MIEFALDTNTLSYFMRGEGQVGARLAAVSPSRVGVPSVVVYEVRYGLLKNNRQQQLKAFDQLLATTTVLDFDGACADHAADIRFHLTEAGTPIGPHDILIAATARRHRCQLVTHNTGEFQRVPALAWVDWY